MYQTGRGISLVYVSMAPSCNSSGWTCLGFDWYWIRGKISKGRFQIFNLKFYVAEQSSSAGILIQDQMQLGVGGVDIVFGCETKETGEIFNQEADGIMGLGNSEVSIVNQVCSAVTFLDSYGSSPVSNFRLSKFLWRVSDESRSFAVQQKKYGKSVQGNYVMYWEVVSYLVTTGDEWNFPWDFLYASICISFKLTFFSYKPACFTTTTLQSIVSAEFFKFSYMWSKNSWYDNL